MSDPTPNFLAAKAEREKRFKDNVRHLRNAMRATRKMTPSMVVYFRSELHRQYDQAGNLKEGLDP